jgi:class 3 adenylate cyclase
VIKMKEYSHKREKNIIDMMLSKNETKTVDSETLLKIVQNRVHDSLKNGYKYEKLIDDSEKFLRKHTFQTIEVAVLYVDLVGSTKMSLELPPDKLSIIISSFVQEMSYVISQHDGFVLKFSGDAVIGYFVGKGSSLQAADSAVGCAESMLKVVENGINPILGKEANLPKLSIKVGIDYGPVTVVQYGADEKNSFVDLLGPSLNMASKVQGVAKPNQIVVGHDVHERLHPAIQELFVDITKDLSGWTFTSKFSKDTYLVYAYKK